MLNDHNKISCNNLTTYMYVYTSWLNQTWMMYDGSGHVFWFLVEVLKVNYRNKSLCFQKLIKKSNNSYCTSEKLPLKGRQANLFFDVYMMFFLKGSCMKRISIWVICKSLFIAKINKTKSLYRLFDTQYSLFIKF